MRKNNFIEQTAGSQPDNPHQKVPVRCNHCDERFWREFKNIHIPHDCPQYTCSLAKGPYRKWCQGCERYIPLSRFGTDATRFDGTTKLCLNCTANNVVTHKALRLLEKHKNGIVDQLGIRLSSIVDQFFAQDGLCYHTKIPLEFNNGLRSIELGSTPSDELILICKALAGSDTLADFILEATRAARGNVRLETKIIHENGRLPSRSRTSDVGYDVHAAENVIIQPGVTQRVNTGIIVCPPEGAYYTIEGRSSLFTAGIMPYRGIIDGTYQGPLEVVLMNNSTEPYSVHVDDRIAQLIIHPIVNADFITVNKFTPIEHGRNDNGWGSSGK